MKFRYLFLASLIAILCQGQVVKNYNQSTNSVNINLEEGTLTIVPITDNAVRIKFYKNDEEPVPELIFTLSIQVPEFQVFDLLSTLEVKGKKIIVTVDKQNGKLTFADQSGKVFLSEKAGSRKLMPDSVMGEPCFLAEQSFESPDDEFILGLGQFQDGHYNIRQVSRRLTQVNSQIAIPFIYSNRGYGLLWHQYGLTDYNPADNYIALEKQKQSDDNTQMVEVTTTSGTKSISQNQSLYQGKFIVPKDGLYSVFLNLGNMDNRQYVVIDGKPCIDQSNFFGGKEEVSYHEYSDEKDSYVYQNYD